MAAPAVMSPEFIRPSQWVVCPALDEAAIHVERALQQTRRKWWESRTHYQRLTDDQPDFSSVLQIFSTEEAALAWKQMREKEEKIELLLSRRRPARDIQPIDRIVLPGFALDQLRNIDKSAFAGVTFIDWLTDHMVAASTHDAPNVDDDLVREMIEEAELALVGYLDPTCVLVDQDEFDRIARTADWRTPGEDPWPHEAQSPFSAIVSHMTRLLRPFCPLPIEGLAKLCGSWQSHWNVIRYAHELAASKMARRLGVDIEDCSKAAWAVRASLNRYSEDLLSHSESGRSIVETTYGLKSTAPGESEPAASPASVISSPGHAGMEQTVEQTETKRDLPAEVDESAPMPREGGPEPDDGPSVVEPVKSSKRERLSSVVESVTAVIQMEKYLKNKSLGLTELATRIGTTDRTLRKFRSSGKLGRDLFRRLAEEMGITPEELMKL